MLADIREQRDRWQQQAERLAALAITDQRKEPAPAHPQTWRRMLQAPTGHLLFHWVVGLLCGGVLLTIVRYPLSTAVAGLVVVCSRSQPVPAGFYRQITGDAYLKEIKIKG